MNATRNATAIPTQRTDTNNQAALRGLGAELLFVGTGRRGESSRKFHRSLQAGNVTITHYGRVGTKGQYSVKRHDNTADAAAFVRDLVAKKQAQTGYWITSPMTEFGVLTADLMRAGSTRHDIDNGSPAHAARVVAAYLAVR